MSLQFGQMVLYSKDPQLLGNFFSELLDKQLVETESGYELQESLDCPFLFAPKSKNQKKPVDTFHLYVDDRYQIDELKQKISFFVYRHQLKDKLFKVKDEGHSIEVSDLDGRVWRISIKQ